jgi:dTDP-4-amino-4,6-dideoxygalactose transaminase
MRSAFLPFARPSIDEAEIAEVVDTLRSGWITTGPKVERFTEAFRTYVGGSFAAPLGSATAGLHLALLAHGIGEGDEVITTPMTFVATLNVIVLAGATPVLADIDRDTLDIRVDQVEKALTPRTRALIPVHYVGQPCDMDPLLEVARSRGLTVIEDAAHAVGAEYRGRRVGSFPTTSVFSFHPNKNMTTGEGGMVVTGDEEVFEKVSLLKFHGMDRNAWKRFAKAGSPRYDVSLPGFKYNMMDLQAAIGLAQLPRLDGFIAARARIAESYSRELKGAPLFLPKPVPWPIRHAWHLYAPLVDLDRLTIDRDRFMEELKARNIGCGLHYSAAHEFSYYRDRFGWAPGDFPEAHFVSERIVSLPLFPAMTEQDRADVVEAVFDIAKKFRR